MRPVLTDRSILALILSHISLAIFITYFMTVFSSL
jgi:hypothetical protein